ncbi:hypothetical protein AYI69_g9998 [Smittium culicis]|uniref:CCHC-type domain-containing protein n=1 Tax=Smittium culicis TaxID=133412 RepID=A0A1R1X8V1_9FUNG|nr:hypothetical protein AYI69_g9998 [Smittium culicis]
MLIKINKEVDIPTHIESCGEKVSIMWIGSPPICTYCKKVDHWKKECTELDKKIKRSRSARPRNYKKSIYKRFGNKYCR